MAKIYRMSFANVDKEYSSGKNTNYIKLRMPSGTPDKKQLVAVDGTLTVLEHEIRTYWEFGDGCIKCELVGEMDNNYFRPTLFEPDFVDNQIKSKKNGEIIGYQG